MNDIDELLRSAFRAVPSVPASHRSLGDVRRRARRLQRRRLAVGTGAVVCTGVLGVGVLTRGGPPAPAGEVGEPSSTVDAGTTPAIPTTTTVIGADVGIVVLNASGIATAGDDLAAYLASYGVKVLQVATGSRIAERSMVMPLTSVAAVLDDVTRLGWFVGITGTDPWASDLLDGTLPAGTDAVVVIGLDRNDKLSHVVPTTTPAP